MERLHAEMTEPIQNSLRSSGFQRGFSEDRDTAAESLEKRFENHQPTPASKRAQRKRLQHPAELPRNNVQAQKAARRQFQSRILPDERVQQPLARESDPSQDGYLPDDPEDFYRIASRQQHPRAPVRRPSSDGRDSAQSKRTSNQSNTEKGHRKQLSQAELELIERLSTPKRITPKKGQRVNRPQTDRELARAAIWHSSSTRQRAVEIPFNDHWSNSRVVRERENEMRGHPNMRAHLEMRGPHDRAGHNEMRDHQNANEEPHDQPTGVVESLSGFASLLGWGEPQTRRPNSYEMHIMSLEKRLWHSQKNNHELKNDIAELSRANDGLQSDLRKIQQKSFTAMSKSTWTPLEDKAIQEILEEIHHDLEEWAEDHCLETFNEVLERLNKTQQAELLEICAKVADVNQPDLASQFQWWDERHLDPVLLLTALVTYRMYTCVFDNEFLAVGTVDQTSMNTMPDIYRELAKLDFKQAQLWRSQLMRIIVGTPQSGGRFDGVSSKLDVSSFIRRYCDDMLDDFGKFCEAAFVKSQLSAESRGSLLNCWTKAAELFVQLQTQVAALQWKVTDRLRLTVNPRFVESHRSQAFPKGRNDGKPISLIISPMVVFHGNEDGERYQDWRAVCKATVLVIPEDLESEEEEEEEEEEDEEGEGEEEEEGEGLSEEVNREVKDLVTGHEENSGDSESEIL